MDLIAVPIVIFVLLAPIAGWVGFFVARRAARAGDAATKELHQVLTGIGSMRLEIEQLRASLQEGSVPGLVGIERGVISGLI
jgi:hypothetical protein